jgi:hypothetical protein
MRDWPERAIEWLIARILDALSRGDRVGPLALTLLVREYRVTGRDDIAAALEPALAATTEVRFDELSPSDADWLMLFVEGAASTGDGRVREAGQRLIKRLRRAWGAWDDVEGAMWSIDACLTAADLVDPRELVPAAIDELERIVGTVYSPGVGLGGKISAPEAVRGRFADHVRTASALLTAFERTGRLPYSMLADELMQFAQRNLTDKPFLLKCEAARVLTRLAVLHASPAYRDAAVLSPNVDYDDDAARILMSFEPEFRGYGVDAAVYGLALTEWAGRS